MPKNFNLLGKISDWSMTEATGKNAVTSKLIKVFIGILKTWSELSKLNKFFKA